MFKSTANGAVAVLNVTKNTSDCWFQVQQNLTASHFPGKRVAGVHQLQQATATADQISRNCKRKSRCKLCSGCRDQLWHPTTAQ
uniref:Laminin N-terminal domain-containing protein n=1 Tax=Macrostomum lignano TaxID=282301 RepID=A0A1I8JG71_9PLAT